MRWHNHGRRAAGLTFILGWLAGLLGGCGGDKAKERARTQEEAQTPDAAPHDLNSPPLAHANNPLDAGEVHVDDVLSLDAAQVTDAESLPSDAGREPRAFNLRHPGILSSQSELDFIRGQISARKQPWSSALADLERSPYAALAYTPEPFHVVECGSYNKPNIGCTEIVADGAAVYAHALLFSLTGNKAHANKALEILDAWATTYERNTESNARLVVAWAAPWYANGAELLRHSGAGFSEAAVERASAMFRTMLPYVQDDERPENNWIHSRIEAHLAIAVFLDDPEELDRAIARFRFWVPMYIYQSSEGAAPINPPGRTAAQTYGVWKSTASGTSFVDGLAMETCRDLGHLGLGFGSMMYAAETAWQQGIDLFDPHKKRFSDFMELHGSFMTGARDVPRSTCGGLIKARQADTQGIKAPMGGGRMVWEIAYHHLHDRLGMELPFSRQMIEAGRPTGGGLWVNKWETLTHAERKP